MVIALDEVSSGQFGSLKEFVGRLLEGFDIASSRTYVALVVFNGNSARVEVDFNRFKNNKQGFINLVRGLGAFECLYVCMFGCLYVCVFGCLYVCVFGCLYVCAFECLYVCMFGCLYVCVFGCLCLFVCVFSFVCLLQYSISFSITPIILITSKPS